MKQLILASASPRRKELLERIGLTLQVQPSRREEVVTCTDPAQIVEELSFRKAEDICSELLQTDPEGAGNAVVLGADTVVALDGRVLGKPKDEQDAYEMLHSLQGRTHHVYTGVTIMEPEGRSYTFSCGTEVTVFPMTDEEIWAYIKTGDSTDKAGSYGIQGPFCAYVKEIAGDYNTVVGLPVSRVYQELKAFGVIKHD